MEEVLEKIKKIINENKRLKIENEILKKKLRKKELRIYDRKETN